MNNTLEQMIDGSVEAINIEDALDLVRYSDREKTFDSVARKIMYGGTVELTGIDLSEIVRAVNQCYVEEAEANSILYCHDRVSSISTLESTCDLIIKKGFTIILQRRNRYHFYIKAKRNEPK